MCLMSFIILPACFTYSRGDSVRKTTQMIVKKEGNEASAMKPQKVFYFPLSHAWIKLDNL